MTPAPFYRFSLYLRIDDQPVVVAYENPDS